MSRFEVAIPTILRHEGGYVNDPVDPGGATNFGVSLRFLTTLGYVGDFDHDGDVDVDDIKKMTREDAIGIYRSQWWDKFHYDQINDQDVATKVFDMAVNMGGKQAHKILQRAMNQCCVTVEVDGVLGSKTMQAINEIPGLMLYHTLQAWQADFYNQLIVIHPEFIKFKKGWLARAFDHV